MSLFKKENPHAPQLMNLRNTLTGDMPKAPSDEEFSIEIYARSLFEKYTSPAIERLIEHIKVINSLTLKEAGDWIGKDKVLLYNMVMFNMMLYQFAVSCINDTAVVYDMDYDGMELTRKSIVSELSESQVDTLIVKMNDWFVTSYLPIYSLKETNRLSWVDMCIDSQMRETHRLGIQMCFKAKTLEEQRSEKRA